MGKNAKKKLTSQQQLRRRMYMKRYIRRRRKKALFHLQDAVYDLIKEHTKNIEPVPYRWEHLVGFNVIQLYHHLDKQFYGGMKWKDYGKTWELDHVIPRSKFNFNSYNDPGFKQCWKLSNLQPLLREHNRIKFTKSPKEWAEYKRKHKIKTK